jgi:hypothetical protein
MSLVPTPSPLTKLFFSPDFIICMVISQRAWHIKTVVDFHFGGQPFPGNSYDRLSPNPNGIPSISPGLRGTRYPGLIVKKNFLPQRGCIAVSRETIQLLQS